MANFVEVIFLERSLLPTGAINFSDHQVILQTHGSECDMQAVDFDEDGDLDLLMGKNPYRYFERVSNGALEERKGEENPLEVFGGRVERVADVDGDGRLDVLVQAEEENNPFEVKWRFFRRTSAGGFAEPLENPLAAIVFRKKGFYSYEVFVAAVADWNSDGSPDLVVLQKYPDQDYGIGGSARSDLTLRLYQNVVDRDLRPNSQFHAYADVPLRLSSLKDFSSDFTIVDWNADGFEDVVVQHYPRPGLRFEDKGVKLRLYEFHGRTVKEVVGVFDNVTRKLNGAENAHVCLADWDGDGDLDLFISTEINGKLELHYHEQIAGTLHEEVSHHPFKSINLFKDARKGIWKFHSDPGEGGS